MSDSFLSSYSDDQMVLRAYFMAVKNKEFITKALEIAQKSKLFYIIKDLHEQSELNSPSIAALYDEPLKIYNSNLQKKQQEIQQFRNVNNKPSLRMSYKDLALLHMNAGNLLSAQEAFLKVHEYNTTQQNADFILQWSQVLLWVLYTKEPPKNASEQEMSDYYGFQLNQTLRSFADCDLNTFMSQIQRIPLSEIKSLNYVTTMKDLGTYYILAALNTLTPTGMEFKQNKSLDFENSLSQENIREITQDNNEVEGIIESYRIFDLPRLIEQTKQLIVRDELINMLIDFHMLNRIEEKIIGSLMKQVTKQESKYYFQYLQSFSVQKLSKIQDLLKLSEGQLISYLEKLIKTEKLNLIIDPIDKLLIVRNKAEDQEIIVYRNLAKTLINNVDEKYRQLINFDIVQAQRFNDYSQQG